MSAIPLDTKKKTKLSVKSYCFKSMHSGRKKSLPDEEHAVMGNTTTCYILLKLLNCQL